jgi:hypothetical protein
MMNDRVKIYQLRAGNQRLKTLIDPKPAIFIITPSKAIPLFFERNAVEPPLKAEGWKG